MSRYSSNLHSTVSRELSDAELQLEDDVDNFVRAPRMDSSPMVSSALAYRMAREETQMRTQKANELSRTQNLAFNSSARRQIHNQTIQNSKQATEADQAFRNMMDNVNKGMNQNDALNDMVRANPQLITNRFFNEAVKPFMAFTEDEDERFLRQNGTAIEKLGMQNELIDATLQLRMGRVKEGQADGILDAYGKQLEAEKINGNTGVLKAKLNEIQAEQDYQYANNFANRFVNLMETRGDTGEASRGMFEEVSAELGSQGLRIQDQEAFMANLGATASKNTLSFLMDGASKAELHARYADEYDTPEQMMKDISRLSDPELPEADKRRIQGMIREGAGIYGQRYKKNIALTEQAEKLEKMEEGLSKQFFSAVEGVNKNLANLNPGAARGAARGFAVSLAEKMDMPISANMDISKMKDELQGVGVDVEGKTDDQIKQLGEDKRLWLYVEDAPNTSDYDLFDKGSDGDSTPNRSEFIKYNNAVQNWMFKKSQVFAIEQQKAEVLGNLENNKAQQQQDPAKVNEEVTRFLPTLGS